ncbi:hypothetical protein THRCLA_02433 [Thraustotheca clavata]|uniref:Uncharacterized protein n=1 Tax=Thraustotheca clavata TaxID=74557 RepID=A0A1W0A591_9STRA|nr:hypothetical protein THRCLA_02433 [Thraustotheca clavata]
MVKVFVDSSIPSNTIDRSTVIPWLREIVGIAYTLLTLGLSIYCLGLLYPYLNNDYVWPNFVSSNISKELVNTFNMHLIIGSNPFKLTDVSSGISRHDHIGVSMAYPRMLMYQELTTLEAAINGLRNLQTINVANMITQYCWVDLEKRWAIAHTYKRQERCWRNYQKNGAVYLETVFRNIDFNSWVIATQNHFNTEIAAGIIDSSPVSGPEFLDYLKNHELWTVNNEVIFWSSFGISIFILQYSNQYQIGLQENLIIENAMGVNWYLPLKSLPSLYRGPLRLTFYMYSGFINDLKILGPNQSLVQNSSTYFGLVNANLFEDITLHFPLAPVIQAVHDQIGCISSIDLYWVPVQEDILQIVRKFRTAILSKIQLDENFKANLLSLGTYQLHPTPLQWQNTSYLFYGGNLMCGFNTGFHFVQESFAFDDTCATQNALTITWTPLTSLFAYIMMNGNSTIMCKPLSGDEFTICVESLGTLSSLSNLVQVGTPPSVNHLELSFLQIIGRNNISFISTQLLLDDSFAFFGWMCIYEWAFLERESVMFEGDIGKYTIMSAATLPRAIREKVISSSTAIYIWYCCCFVTFCLVGVAIILVGLWIIYRPLSCPWFMFNRITSAIWLNRSILIIRGIAAILCLSSSTLVPTTVDNQVFFHELSTSFFTICLFAGEATWITYVFHEALQPFTLDYTALPSRFTSLFLWIILIILTLWSPVEATYTLDRTCFSENMDIMIFCTSGSICIGSKRRAIVLVLIIGSVAIINAIVIVVNRKSKVGPIAEGIIPSLLLPSAALAYLDVSLSVDVIETRINVISAAMVGILRVYILGLKIHFDTKLWIPLYSQEVKDDGLILSIPNSYEAAKLLFLGPKLVPQVQSLTRIDSIKLHVQYLIIVGGIFYVLLSLVSNFTYSTLAQSFLSNDFGWTGFNTTGMHTFLANQLNVQLMALSNTTINLTNATLIDIGQHYNQSNSQIYWSTNAPRRQLNNAANPLKDIIIGLRKLNPCQLPWMFTQYCFVDFNRTWAMANSIKRQTRCQQEIVNGAVYFEAPLRNIRDWDVWNECWGLSFSIGFEQYLNTNELGKMWLQQIYNNKNSIHEEVNLWHLNGITRFQLQWQNYKTMGMTDTINIVSALGFSTPLTISTYEERNHIKQQTSMRMYWSFASDLWAIASNITNIGGMSLISSSSNFAFDNISSASLLFQNLTLIQPLNEGLTKLQSVVGPFGSIDMKYVSPPFELLKFYTAFLDITNSLLLNSSEAQENYNKIPVRPYSCQAPPFLLSNNQIIVNGGNIMCGDDVPQQPAAMGYLSGFGKENVCNTIFIEYVAPTTRQILFGFMGLKVSIGKISDIDLVGICNLDKCAGTLCPVDFNFTRQFLKQYYFQYAQLTPIINEAKTVVQGMNIQIIQFYNTLLSVSPTNLYTINLLEPTEPYWSYYGWTLLYGWVVGLREVVEFQGDSGSLVTISYRDPLITLSADPTEIPVSFSSILAGCAFYVSWILIIVASLVAMFAIFERGLIEGLNLFEFNRIVGHSWAGRTFLTIRSITAIWMLNTVPLDLALNGQVTHIVSPQLPWYQTILASSEVTWLVYVLNDLLSCVTRQYTTYYAVKSALSTWFVIAVWSLISPPKATVTLDRHCEFINMDDALVCVSGSIKIGSSTGVISVILAAVGCIVVSYTMERLVFPKVPPLEIRSFLLNAHSLYMLDLTHWKLDGKYYLDKSSAVMCGLLSFHYKEKLYILDIKSWRVIVIAAPKLRTFSTSSNTLDRFENAIPLDHC